MKLVALPWTIIHLIPFSSVMPFHTYVAKQTLFNIHLEDDDDDKIASLETEMVKNIIFTINRWPIQLKMGRNC